MNKSISNEAIRFRDYSISYGKKTILNNIDYSVSKGSFHALLGPNGSGKTSMIKTIIGANTRYGGEILINNINSSDASSKIGLGYVPENANFDHSVTTFDYLYEFSKLLKIDSETIIERIDILLKEFNIFELKEKRPSRFSAGQKKMVLLIRALINEPSILILDEPSANLDPIMRDKLFKILVKINDKGTTIFITSHVLDELNLYIDSLTIIGGGKLKYSGPKKTVNQDAYIKLSSKEDNELLKKFLIKNKIKHTFEKEEFEIDWEKLKFVKEFIIKSGITPETFGIKEVSVADLYASRIGGNNDSSNSI